MTIETCDTIHVSKGRCLLDSKHIGPHFFNDNISELISEHNQALQMCANLQVQMAKIMVQKMNEDNEV